MTATHHYKSFAQRWPWLLLALCLGLLGAEQTTTRLAMPSASAQSNTLVVTNLNDSGPGSLRQALADAVEGDTITFAPEATGVLILSSGLQITKSLTLHGPGAEQLIIQFDPTLDIPSTALIRVENVASQSPLTLTGLTLANSGLRTGLETWFSPVYLSDCVIRDNAIGARIYWDSSLTVSRCRIFNNSSGLEVYYGGALTMSDSQIYSTYDENYSTGVYAGHGASVLLQNTGIYSNTQGLWSDQTPLTMINSTVSGNRSLGVFVDAAVITSTYTTLANNLEADLTLRGASRMVAENSSLGRCAVSTASAVTSWGHNLAQTACGLTHPTDQENVDPRLLPLADNGGDTLTHALAPNSPALDAADATLCPPTDQRGVARPQGVHCDIGAYEKVPTGFGLSASPAAFKVAPGQAFTYTLYLSNWSGLTATQVSLTPTLSELFVNVEVTASLPFTVTGEAWQLPDLPPTTSGFITFTGVISPDLAEDTALVFQAQIGAAETSLLEDTQNTITAVVRLPQVSFAVANDSVRKNQPNLTATVTLNQIPYVPVTIGYTTQDDTAVAGADYVTTTGELQFAPGEMTTSLVVPLLDNPDNRDRRSFKISLTPLTGTVAGPISNTLITVVGSSMVVTNTNDAGEGSLRQALLNALPGETITFAPEVTGTLTITSGTLYITQSVTIAGPGPEVLQIDFNQADIGLVIQADSTVTLSGLNLLNARYQAIYNQGSLTMTTSHIHDNGCNGLLSDGPFVGRHLQFYRNSQTQYNCEALLAFNQLNLSDSQIYGNRSHGLRSHGLDIQPGTDARLERVAIYDNGESGIWSYSDRLTVTASAIFNNGTYGVVASREVWLTNVTLSDNRLNGFDSVEPNTTLRANNVTIAGNGGYGIQKDSLAGDELVNSVVAHNGSANCEQPIRSLGYNVVNDASCELNAAGDQVVADARLGALMRSNAASVRPLLPDSPAINAGNPAPPGSAPAACASFDQTGAARAQDTRCDSGAYEAPPLPDLALTQQASASLLAPGDWLTYTLDLTNIGLQAATSIVLTDSLPTDLLTPTLEITGLMLTPLTTTPLVWQVGDLAPGAGGRITLTAQVNPALDHDVDLVNATAVTLGVPEHPFAPNQSVVTTTVRLPRLSWGAPRYTAHKDAAAITLTLWLTPTANIPVQAHFATYDGSAHTGRDYQPLSGTVSFAPGEAQQTVSVPLINNPDNTDQLTLTLQLSQTVGALLAGNNETLLVLSVGKRWVTNLESDGAGSLADAVRRALPDDAIYFVAELAGTIYLNDTLVINQPLKIFGPGAAVIQVSGSSQWRILEVAQAATVNLSGLTLTEGFATASRPRNCPDLGQGGGGAVQNLGTLTITASVIRGNLAICGGGIYNGGRLYMAESEISANHLVQNLLAPGGGLYANRQSDTQLERVTISGNQADQGGGFMSDGVFSLTGSVIAHNQARLNGGGGVIEESTLAFAHNTIYSNTAGTFGGGIFYGVSVEPIPALLTQNAIYENVAGQGGGIFSYQPLRLSQTAVYKNQAQVNGGGLYIFSGVQLEGDVFYENVAGGLGGGVFIPGGWEELEKPKSISNTVLSGNRAVQGGAFFVESNPYFNPRNITLTQVTVADNFGQAMVLADNVTLVFANSLIGLNSGGSCSSAASISLGYNLSYNGGCGLSAASDISSSEPQLGPFGDYGGTLPTAPLLPGSLALDALPGPCPATDVRGVARPQGAACDIGAFEALPAADVALRLSAASAIARPGQPFTYSLLITNGGLVTASSILITDVMPALLQNVVSQTDGLVLTPSLTAPFVWEAAPLAPYASGRLTLTGLISPSLAVETTFTNTAQVSTASPEINLAPNTASVVTVVRLTRVRWSVRDILLPTADTALTLTVRLDAPSELPIVVNYRTLAGTALAGTDYLTATGTLTFTPGVTEQTLVIELLDNPANPATRQLALELWGAQGALLDANALLFIRIAPQLHPMYLPLAYRVWP